MAQVIRIQLWFPNLLDADTCTEEERMKIKTILCSIGMLALLGACDTMSEYGSKMKEMVGLEKENKHVVYFQSNSTALTEDSEGTLYDVMQEIRQDKVGTVRVIAYTDSKGSPRYNQQLSMRRAESIKKRLSTSGVRSIDVSGAGEESGSDSVTGAKARRAEIFLDKK